MNGSSLASFEHPSGKRCPAGSRRNKKTGRCKPYRARTTAAKKAPTQGKRPRCPRGTRRNKRTGKCEPKPSKKSAGAPTVHPLAAALVEALEALAGAIKATMFYKGSTAPPDAAREQAAALWDALRDVNVAASHVTLPPEYEYYLLEGVNADVAALGDVLDGIADGHVDETSPEERKKSAGVVLRRIRLLVGGVKNLPPSAMTGRRPF